MKYISLKMFTIYLAVLLSLIVIGSAKAQNPCGNDEICVVQFNAGFNEANKVDWVEKLGDCEKETKSIDGNSNQKDYSIAVVPTIVIFDDGEEVKRFQADLSFKMVATRKEVQDFIDELIISKF